MEDGYLLAIPCEVNWMLCCFSLFQPDGFEAGGEISRNQIIDWSLADLGERLLSRRPESYSHTATVVGDKLKPRLFKSAFDTIVGAFSKLLSSFKAHDGLR